MIASDHAPVIADLAPVIAEMHPVRDGRGG
jgi:hypothetical protein